MAIAAAESVGVGPPDVRGPTAPLPVSIFACGVASLSLSLGSVAVIQVLKALVGAAPAQSCLSSGQFAKSDPGIEGVCHIVAAAQSSAQGACLIGGIALGLIVAALGFGIYRRMDTRRKRGHAFAGAVLGLQGMVMGVFFLFFFSSPEFLYFAHNFLNFVLLKGNLGAFLSGMKITVFLAFAGEAGGIVLGLILALFTTSQYKVVRAPARAYINFFRGTPLIWQLSFFYLGISIGLRLSFLNSSFVTAVLVFVLNTGAYASEVFRAGIQSIERGQFEAARGLGLSYFQAMRYAIVPQAVRRVIPPLMNEFVILIKDTSLIVVLGLISYQRDIFSVSQDGYSTTYNATYFVAAALGYLIITLPLIRLVNAAERRLRSGLVGIAGAGAA